MNHRDTLLPTLLHLAIHHLAPPRYSPAPPPTLTPPRYSQAPHPPSPHPHPTPPHPTLPHPCPAGVVPSGTFKTMDAKYVVIGGNGDSIYSRLMAAIGRPDMGASNPQYKTNSDRLEREEEIMGEISQWVARHTLGG